MQLIRFDWAIKRMLRDKANYVVVEGLLTVLLGRQIHIKSLLESEGNQQDASDKFNRVDLLAEDNEGELMLFEIQNDRELDYFHRMTYGVSKVITEYINLGDDYDRIRKVYSINIVYFDLGQGLDYVYRGRTEFRGVHEPHDELHLSSSQRSAYHCDTPGDIMPEYYLLRVDEFDKVATTPLDEWISFLKTGEIPAKATAPGLPEARERLRVDTLPDDQRRQYYRDMENLRYQRSVLKTGRIEGLEEGRKEGRKEGLAEGMAKGKAEGLVEGMEKGKAEGLAEGMEKGKAEGKAEGLAEGRNEERIAIARKMLSSGMTAEQVAQITGLTEEELQKMKAL